MIRLEKKTKCSLQGGGREETALKFEISNTRSNNPPYIWLEYCERWNRLKLWNKWSTLATFSSNIWSRLKSPAIKILCCVEIKSSMKEQRWPDIQYIITNKFVSACQKSAHSSIQSWDAEDFRVPTPKMPRPLMTITTPKLFK